MIDGAWPPAPVSSLSGAPPPPGRVDVFAFALDPSEERRAALCDTLAADERERAARYRFAVHRRAFEACRGAVREILGRYLALTPAAVSFQYGPQGKPANFHSLTNLPLASKTWTRRFWRSAT